MSEGPPPPPPPPPPPGQPPPPGWGQPPPQYYGPYAQAPRTDGTATAVLVLSICSWVFLGLCGLGFIAAIVALCLAPGAKRNIAQSGGTLTGESLVKAGVIVSWINIGVVAIGLVIFIIVVAASSGTDNSFVPLLPALS